MKGFHLGLWPIVDIVADRSLRSIGMFFQFCSSFSCRRAILLWQLILICLQMHDAGLMSAILALSSRQLSLHPSSKEEQRDRNIGLQYYYETLHYLQKAMHYDSYTVSLELLATALAVSTYEMLDDSGSGWERHLKGVFWIQRSQVIHGESEGLKSAVWWAWLRQDVWAAFRERRNTLSFWKPKKAYNTMTPYELAARSVWLFAKAVDYCSNEEIKIGEENLQPRIEKAETIFGMLDEWQGYLTTEFTPLPSRKVSPTDVFEPIWIHPPAFGMCTVPSRGELLTSPYSCINTVTLLCENPSSSSPSVVRRHAWIYGTAKAACESC